MSVQQLNLADVAEQANSISCYSGVPAFVKGEIEHLYSHLFSSVPFFETFRTTLFGGPDCWTYIERLQGRPTTILILSRRDGRVEVLNEMISIEEDALQTFVDYVFTHFDEVGSICFNAIRAARFSLAFPHQQHNSKEDFVIALPATAKEYTERIGHATRRNIKRYMKKIRSDFPGFSYRFYAGEEITEEQIREIIRLSQMRIFAKKKRFGIDEEEVRSMIALARKCGLLNVMTIDGKICAGTICCHAGGGYLAMVNAHSPEYDAYWLGTLCYYLTICESIERGGRTFHMGGGRYDYKTRLLGVRQDMDHLTIYRSYTRAAVHFNQVVRNWVRNGLRKTKLWLLERESSFISQFVLRTLFLLRKR